MRLKLRLNLLFYIQDESPDLRSGSETDDESDRFVETSASFSELEDTFDAMLTLVRSEHACHGNHQSAKRFGILR